MSQRILRKVPCDFIAWPAGNVFSQSVFRYPPRNASLCRPLQSILDSVLFLQTSFYHMRQQAEGLSAVNTCFQSFFCMPFSGLPVLRIAAKKARCTHTDKFLSQLDKSCYDMNYLIMSLAALFSLNGINVAPGHMPPAALDILIPSAARHSEGRKCIVFHTQ